MSATESPGAERTHTDLDRLLAGLDGRGYKTLKRIEGRWRFPDLTLWIDHVQGDPFAEPSRVRLVVGREVAGFPPELIQNRDRRRAVGDFLLRVAATRVDGWGRLASGSGHSGRVLVERPGQEVLEHSGALIDEHQVELRLRVGLPATGRRILAAGARRILIEALPALARAVLDHNSLDAASLAEHARVVEDQAALRRTLASHGLVAFLRTGAILPRASGVDPRPLTGPDVVPLECPDTLRVELALESGGTVSGMGIAEGVTLIVGGGFHGKSTLLAALAMGVYDHPPGDGREGCVTREDAVKIRAEDGRSVTGVDISPFIRELPGGGETAAFSTGNASGSTSQAAGIVEALETGSRLLLIDEDTSATNFMIRDARMRELVPASHEPIVPLVDRVRELEERCGVSTILVMGGSGDYLDVADRVIHMDAYRPRDVTAAARRIAGAKADSHRERHTPLAVPVARHPDPGCLDRRGGRHEKLIARGRRELVVGRSSIDLGALEQLAVVAQTRGVADALAWFGRRHDTAPLTVLLDAWETELDTAGLDGITGWPSPDRARPRRYEVAAALNRYRGLRMGDRVRSRPRVG